MDPNVAFEQLRGWAAEALAKAPIDSQEYEAAQAFDDLDNWLVNGGFKPDAWAGRS